MAGKAERRYAFQPDEGYGFHAGIGSDGHPLLIGLFCPNLITFFFDSDGRLLRVETRPLDFFRQANPPYNIYHEQIDSNLNEWKQELGFQPSVIAVKKFFSQEFTIGIEDYPNHVQEILSDAETSEEEKNETYQSMILWDRDGQFVFHWGNDYWLNDSGHVVSS